jgi:primase-polymerase (primpol)-like protein
MTAEIVTNKSIPEALRNRPQWKVTTDKNPGHGWNIAENLRTYDQALDHARKIGADGAIYIVLGDDPYTFVDLDGVRDPETGRIETWAQEIIDRLDSYTEVSSSGRGVHVLVEAHTPGPRTRSNALPGFEMYARSRPALVTGDRLNGKGIEPRQDEIDSLYHEVFPPETQSGPADGEATGLSDVEVLDKLFAEDNGPKWSAVLDGVWGEHYTSRSDADYAIAGKLAFYSGDREQVERIMNRSGLYRAKFDTMRGPVTYLQQRIWRDACLFYAASGASVGFRDRGSVSSQLDAVRKHYCTAFYEL